MRHDDYKRIIDVMGQDIIIEQNRENNITVFEHGFLPYEDYNFTNETIDLFEKVNSKSNKKIFTFYLNGLKASEQVGLVQIKDKSIEILPKIFKKNLNDLDKIEQSRENLLYLLQLCFDLPAYENELSSMQKQKSNWFEILTFIFANNLERLLERGPPRQYVSLEENIPVLKGKWLFTQHIKANPFQKHRFFVQYDEFSMDNPLSRIFKYVTNKLKYQSQNELNRKKLNMLDIWMDDVTLLQSISPSDFDKITFTRQNNRFEPIFNLCKLFILNQVVSTKAANSNAFAFTFDMNLLFELFVSKFLIKHKRKILPEELENCKIIPQAIGSIKYLAKTEDRYVFRMQPDIILLSSNNLVPIIIDTKYKPLDTQNPKLGISQTDMYQMAAYSAVYKCNFLVLLYPQYVEMEKPIHKNFILMSNEANVNVETIDLNRNLKDSTNELIKDFKNMIKGWTGYEKCLEN